MQMLLMQVVEPGPGQVLCSSGLLGMGPLWHVGCLAKVPWPPAGLWLGVHWDLHGYEWLDASSILFCLYILCYKHHIQMASPLCVSWCESQTSLFARNLFRKFDTCKEGLQCVFWNVCLAHFCHGSFSHTFHTGMVSHLHKYNIMRFSCKVHNKYGSKWEGEEVSANFWCKQHSN